MSFFPDNIRRYLPKNVLDFLLYGIFILAILKIFTLYQGINEDGDGDWNVFKEQHHCQLKKNGESNVQSTWECDDGKTYYRWRQLKS